MCQTLKIIICQDFFPPPGRKVMSSQLSHAKSPTSTHILIFECLYLVFCSSALFKFLPTAPCNGPLSAYPAVGHQLTRTKLVTSPISITQICTRALHSFQPTVLCRAVSTVIPLLTKATFTLFMHALLHNTHWSALHSSSTYFLHRHSSSHTVKLFQYVSSNCMINNPTRGFE